MNEPHRSRRVETASHEPPETAFERFHPLTPIVAAWRALAVLFAVFSYQNIDLIHQIIDSGAVSLRNLGITSIVILVVVLLGIVAASVSWWATKYAVTESGVYVRERLISTHRRIAPRERIDSCSIERPLVARLVGLSKVRVELAGSGDSHIELAYLTKKRAREIHDRVLELAEPAAASTPAVTGVGEGTASEATALAAHAKSQPGALGYAIATSGAHAVSRAGIHDPKRRTRDVRPRAGDGDAGELAKIPVSRLLMSLLRDIEVWLSIAGTLVFSALVIVGVIVSDSSWGLGALAGLIPALLLAPRVIYGKLEASWMFVSRATGAGISASRGLLDSRTDNLAATKIQTAMFKRPLLWRGPKWTLMRVRTAGVDIDDADQALEVLPVGTFDELARTMGHILPHVGALADHPVMASSRVPRETPGVREAQDDGLIRAFLSEPARELPGARPVHWSFPIARRTHVVALSEHAVIHRKGVLSSKVIVIPRDRIQNVELKEGIFDRAFGWARLTIHLAGTNVELPKLPGPQALALFDTLAHDARTLRRYSDRARWNLPALSSLRSESPSSDRTPAPAWREAVPQS